MKESLPPLESPVQVTHTGVAVQQACYLRVHPVCGICVTEHEQRDEGQTEAGGQESHQRSRSDIAMFS